MPYIKRVRRIELDSPVRDTPKSPGELNYVITKLILGYIGNLESYVVYNDVIGVLECIKQELYRRKIAYYEDKKKEENGDVY
jgi:hypothetical protein